MLNVEPQPAIQTHPLIRDPRKEKEREHISRPGIDQEAEIGNQNHKQSDPVREAILAGPDVKEFSDEDIGRVFTVSLRPVPPFLEDLLLSDCPRNGRYHERQDQDPVELR